jgi:hypothetical protein
MKSALLKKVLLSAAVLLFGLAAAEGVARLLYRRTTVMFPRFHTDAHYGEFTMRRLRPHTRFWHTSIDGQWEFRINGQGFRADKDYAYEKAPGCQRVICLGDSHTEGFECRQEHTFAAVIERYFAVRGKCVEAINAGASGFGTTEELVFLENEGVKFHPDFVVVGFYENDFDDNVRCNMFGLKNGSLVTNSTSYMPGVQVLNRINDVPPLRWLSQHSYLYSIGFNGLWEYRKRQVTSASQAKVTTEMAVRPADAAGYLAQYQKDLVVALLARMHAWCRAHGARLIVLDIPGAEGTGFKSSIPQELRDAFRQNCDALILSDQALGDYRGLMPLHAPHGQRHISEEAHMIFGLHVSKAMERFFEGKPAS